MPFNGSGVFTPKHIWVTEAASGTPILPDRFDDQAADMATGLSNAILRDGTGGPTVDIPWNNFGITGLRAPVAPLEASNKAYVDTATSDRSMGGYKMTNLAAPVAGADAANMTYVLQVAMNASLPNQAGNAGKFVTTDGANSSWAWPQNMPRSARTANTAVAVADRATLIDITANTFTQTFTAAATLGSGWYCWLRNSGSGDITLDPNGAELIDGLTSYVMYPGEARLIQCDGTGFMSVVVRPFSKTFTAGGTFVKAPGYQQIGGKLWAAGGSGCKSSSTSNFRAGGAGGGCSDFVLPTSVIGASEIVIIGSGGAAVTADGSTGNAGGNSSFGSLVTSYGGQGGPFSTSSSGTNATSLGGNAYSSSFTHPAVSNPVGSSSIFEGYLSGGSGYYVAGYRAVHGGGGGAGLPNAASPTTNSGGPSQFGGSGGASNAASSGVDGVAPGGGGGATSTGAQSGAGARGELRIWGVV